MSRAAKLRGIAINILGSFVSRNNDVDGYWAIGRLYDVARECRTGIVTVNLLSKTIEPCGTQWDFSRMLDKYASMLGIHLEKVRVPADSLTKGAIRLSFDSAVTDARPPSYLSGLPFRCTFELGDNAEHLLSVSHLGVARPHDPLKESRSTRR
jgi:hypothetical protein